MPENAMETTMTKNNNGSIVLSFAVEKETKNAVRFMEVDDAGKQVEADKAKIGTLYVKKTAFEGGKWPTTLAVTLS